MMADLRSFNGDLSLISPVYLFQLIKLASLSGHLIFTCAENTTHFFCTEGKLNYAVSRQGRKRIGQTLLESQLITTEQLKVCLDQQRETGKGQKLGSIFVKNGYLKQSQLIEIFQEELKSALFETITWTEGEFRFLGTSPLAKGDIILEEDIESLILRGLVFSDEGKI